MYPNQSVILYRSRTEAEIDRLIWEGDGSFFVVFGFLIIWVLCFVVIYKLVDKFKLMWIWKNKSMTYICAGVATPVAYVVCKIINKLILM